MALLKDQRFYELCTILQIQGQIASDPDRKTIEKAFRRLALKTHPDKGGDPVKFRLINDAYNKLIAHVDRMQRMEMEAELRSTSVIIEISKQALPKWWEKLKSQYGQPKTSDVKSTIFQGPYKQYKGRGKLTGPITLILFEDPEDKVPKIMCKCENYMAWIQEQKMPLHLHVDRDKKIMFDQWRIMSLAEFNFANIDPSSSARHDWKNQDCSSTPRTPRKQDPAKEREERERREREREEEERRAKEREEEERQKQAEEEAERKRKERAEQESRPWWHQYADKYKGFNIGETTPPPDSDYSSGPPPPQKDDGFPKVFNMTSNTFTTGGLASDTPLKKTEDSPPPPPPTAEDEPKVESEPPKQRETKKQRREKLAKAAAAKTEAKPESKPQPSSTEPVNSAEKPERVKSSKEEPAQAMEPERVETPKEEPVQPMESEPVKLVKEEPVESMESEPVKSAVPQSVPVEIIETEPIRMSQAIPVETIEPEPVKPVEVVEAKPEPVIVIELEPVKVHRAETVVLSEPVVTPVVIEEVKPVVVDHEEVFSSSIQSETQVTPDELSNPISEAELKKRDIGKIAEKLVTKSKIKKIKTKKAVLRKSSIASEATLETDNQTLDEDGKENRSEQQLNGDDLAPGSKARKRPLEDATADWTTEGGRPQAQDVTNVVEDDSRKTEENLKYLEDSTLEAGQMGVSYEKVERLEKVEEVGPRNAAFDGVGQNVRKVTETETEKNDVCAGDKNNSSTDFVEAQQNVRQTEQNVLHNDIVETQQNVRQTKDNILQNNKIESQQNHQENDRQESKQNISERKENILEKENERTANVQQNDNSETELIVRQKDDIEKGNNFGRKENDQQQKDDHFQTKENVKRNDNFQAEMSVGQKVEISDSNENILQIINDDPLKEELKNISEEVENPSKSSFSDSLSKPLSQEKSQLSITGFNQIGQIHSFSETGARHTPAPTSRQISVEDNDEDDSWDEDSVPLTNRRRIELSQNSLSVSRGVVETGSNPRSSDEQKSLSPFSSEYHESARRFSSTENVPSRWRRGSTTSQPQHQQQLQQPRLSMSSSRSSLAREDPRIRESSNDGVFRSKSVHLLCAREPSPRTDYSTPNRFSVSAAANTINERIFAREMRATSYAPTPPPSIPPPPLPKSPYLGFDRKYRSSENVESSRQNESKTSTDRFALPKSQFLRPSTSSEFKVGYATTVRNSSSTATTTTSNISDKIPSRFRRAREHAAAASAFASNPDLSRSKPEFLPSRPESRNSDFHEQIRLARFEHQRCCDEAKSFDPKKNYVRSKSFAAMTNNNSSSNNNNSNTSRSTTPGPLSSMPSSPSGESSLRRGSSRYLFR